MKHLTLLIWATMLWAGPIGAAEHQVQMKNQGADGAMVFEPGTIKVEKGDTVKFVATDKMHNSQSLLVPEGAAAWNGKVDEEIAVTLDQEGVYIYQCLPHSVLGMVGIIQVGQPVNLEQAKARAKELSTSMVAGKDRLDRYLGHIK